MCNWPPSSSRAKVKNTWSYTSTPPRVFIAWCCMKHGHSFYPSCFLLINHNLRLLDGTVEVDTKSRICFPNGEEQWWLATCLGCIAFNSGKNMKRCIISISAKRFRINMKEWSCDNSSQRRDSNSKLHDFEVHLLATIQWISRGCIGVKGMREWAGRLWKIAALSGH